MHRMLESILQDLSDGGVHVLRPKLLKPYNVFHRKELEPLPQGGMKYIKVFCEEDLFQWCSENNINCGIDFDPILNEKVYRLQNATKFPIPLGTLGLGSSTHFDFHSIPELDSDILKSPIQHLASEIRNSLNDKLSDAARIWGVNPDDEAEVKRRCVITNLPDTDEKELLIDGYLVLRFTFPKVAPFDINEPLRITSTFTCSQVIPPPEHYKYINHK